MHTTKKTAIVLGATGLTGRLLVEQLISDTDYAEIKLFTRRPTQIVHPKVSEFVLPLEDLEQYGTDFTGDVVFCCIGTTKAKTKDQQAYRAIDYGIPVKAATLAAANHIETFIVISAIGANAKSAIFYNRTKGEMEAGVLSTSIPNIYIVRPSLITGPRQEKRFGETLGKVVMRFFDLLLIGPAKKYRSIEAACIAAAMRNLARKQYSKNIVESHELQRICRNSEA